jgi:glycerophosphoryl diester phosphodiesterase
MLRGSRVDCVSAHPGALYKRRTDPRRPRRDAWMRSPTSPIKPFQSRPRHPFGRPRRPARIRVTGGRPLQTSRGLADQTRQVRHTGSQRRSRGHAMTRQTVTLGLILGWLMLLGSGDARTPSLTGGSVKSPWLVKQLNHEFVVIGHRGDPRMAPENTLPSIISAFDMGAGMVEIDVQLSRDGVPVVFHDEDTLGRTTNGRGRVGDLTLAQLKQLDAGSWQSSRWAGTRIPTLAEAMVAARARGGRLLIDLKEEAMGAAIADVIRQVRFPSHMLVVGAWTETQRADAIRHLPGAQVLKTDSEPTTWTAADFEAERSRGIAGFEVGDNWTPGFIEAAHAHGMPVYAYTINDEPTMRRLIALGIDGIETDDPALLSRVVREIAGRP